MIHSKNAANDLEHATKKEEDSTAKSVRHGAIDEQGIECLH